MGATLGLKSVKPEAENPVFNPGQHFGEVGGEEGVRYIQGKAYFNNAKHFVRIAPEAAWLPTLTAKQEQDRKVQAVKNGRYFAKATGPAEIPQKIVDAERENARARAAEIQAD